MGRRIKRSKKVVRTVSRKNSNRRMTQRRSNKRRMTQRRSNKRRVNKRRVNKRNMTKRNVARRIKRTNRKLLKTLKRLRGGELTENGELTEDDKLAEIIIAENIKKGSERMFQRRDVSKILGSEKRQRALEMIRANKAAKEAERIMNNGMEKKEVEEMGEGYPNETTLLLEKRSNDTTSMNTGENVMAVEDDPDGPGVTSTRPAETLFTKN